MPPRWRTSSQLSNCTHSTLAVTVHTLTPWSDDDETTYTITMVDLPAFADPDPVEMIFAILRATGQALLPRQLSNTLDRMSQPTTPATVEDLLNVAARREPRLQRDELGRWRIDPDR